jgi:hypothetical protein
MRTPQELTVAPTKFRDRVKIRGRADRRDLQGFGVS